MIGFDKIMAIMFMLAMLRTVPKFVEAEVKLDISTTHIYMTIHSLSLAQANQLSDGIKLVFRANHISEMMQSRNCLNVSKISTLSYNWLKSVTIEKNT